MHQTQRQAKTTRKRRRREIDDDGEGSKKSTIEPEDTATEPRDSHANKRRKRERVGARSAKAPAQPNVDSDGDGLDGAEEQVPNVGDEGRADIGTEVLDTSAGGEADYLLRVFNAEARAQVGIDAEHSHGAGDEAHTQDSTPNQQPHATLDPRSGPAGPLQDSIPYPSNPFANRAGVDQTVQNPDNLAESNPVIGTGSEVISHLSSPSRHSTPAVGDVPLLIASRLSSPSRGSTPGVSYLGPPTPEINQDNSNLASGLSVAGTPRIRNEPTPDITLNESNLDDFGLHLGPVPPNPAIGGEQSIINSNGPSLAGTPATGTLPAPGITLNDSNLDYFGNLSPIPPNSLNDNQQPILNSNVPSLVGTPETGTWPTPGRVVSPGDDQDDPYSPQYNLTIPSPSTYPRDTTLTDTLLREPIRTSQTPTPGAASIYMSAATAVPLERSFEAETSATFLNSEPDGFSQNEETQAAGILSTPPSTESDSLEPL